MTQPDQDDASSARLPEAFAPTAACDEVTSQVGLFALSICSTTSSIFGQNASQAYLDNKHKPSKQVWSLRGICAAKARSKALHARARLAGLEHMRNTVQ